MVSTPNACTKFSTFRVLTPLIRKDSQAPNENVLRSKRKLPAGLYDEPVTLALQRALKYLDPELVHSDAIDSHHLPHALGRVLHQRILLALSSLKGKDAQEKQLLLANKLLELLPAEKDQFASPAQNLQAILEPVQPPAKPQLPSRPSIPLSLSDLVVNGYHDLSLGPEIRKELVWTCYAAL